ASGGELSRVMLGLNVVTGSDVPTLAFDEVDAGIGGQTARAVGALLKRLAAEHQVLVVTHLPQVAAFADRQFYVEKLERNGRTVTRVSRLEPHEREAELARMLSGAVTETALAHARELLQEVQAVR
ncbi:MAG TPA: DNA repair protein RecN, partial [Trueperaceae bacterium]